MTEFEVITNALDRVKHNYTFFSYPKTDDIFIEIDKAEDIELQLCFDKEGKLVETYVWGN